MAISINQMRQVLSAGKAVPTILEKALPKLDDAAAKLARFGDDVHPVPVDKVIERADGTYAQRATAEVMDMPWSDAANLRSGVRNSIEGVEKLLAKARAGVHAAGPGTGAPSEALVAASKATSELQLAKAQLGESLRPWVGEFGGAHAQLVPEHVTAAGEHLGRARRLMEAMVRQHVNVVS